jgi:hypothetical protein
MADELDQTFLARAHPDHVVALAVEMGANERTQVVLPLHQQDGR